MINWCNECRRLIDYYGRTEIRLWTHNRHPIARPHGRAMGVYCEYMGGDCYNGTTLYIVSTFIITNVAPISKGMLNKFENMRECSLDNGGCDKTAGNFKIIFFNKTSAFWENSHQLLFFGLSLILKQYWFRIGLPANRRQAITYTNNDIIHWGLLMGWCKTVVSPLVIHRRYHSLPLSL